MLGGLALGAQGWATPAHATPGQAPVVSHAAAAGCFVGNPDGSDPIAMAAFEAAFDAHVAVMGTAPSFMNSFLNLADDLWSWPSDAAWTAWSWKQSSRSANLIPVLGVPMANDSDWQAQPALWRFQAIAAGQYDQVFAGIASAWRDAGFSLIYARLGYEHNGTFMPWWTGTDPTDWILAFRRIAAVMRAVPGITVRVVWNPNLMGSGQLDVRSTYPGNDSVDVMGIDCFSWMWPSDTYDWQLKDGTYDSSVDAWLAKQANCSHWWDYPGCNAWNPHGPAVSWGMARHVAFARRHGKPTAVCECGTGGSDSNGSVGARDNPFFPRFLSYVLFGPAAPPCAFVNIWDVWNSDGNWLFNDGSEPQAALAWRAHFGAG